MEAGPCRHMAQGHFRFWMLLGQVRITGPWLHYQTRWRSGKVANAFYAVAFSLSLFTCSLFIFPLFKGGTFNSLLKNLSFLPAHLLHRHFYDSAHPSSASSPSCLFPLHASPSSLLPRLHLSSLTRPCPLPRPGGTND